MISKRLRYEILRRDNQTCRYCGAKAPDVELTVDHVVPRTLGGDDQPTNLVAACRDCNAGKSSVPVDAPLVDQVAADQLRWAAALEAAADTKARQAAAKAEYINAVDDAWTRYGYRPYSGPIPRPIDWVVSVTMFYDRGLPLDNILDAVQIACTRDLIDSGRWRYCMGISWKLLAEIETEARTIYDSGRA